MQKTKERGTDRENNLQASSSIEKTPVEEGTQTIKSFVDLRGRATLLIKSTTSGKEFTID